MNQRFSVRGLMAAFAAVACLAGAATAQEDSMPARPMYGHPKPVLSAEAKTPATPLTTWNGTFTSSGKTYKYNMVGSAPTGGAATTIPVFFIPIRMVYKTTKGTTTFDAANHKLTNGQTVAANVLASPIFQSGVDFTSGGTDLGSTQYIDAFQRGNFWSTVSTKTGYHLLLGTPKVMPELTLTVPTADGKVGTEFGVRVGLASITWFDAQLQAYIKKTTSIVPDSLPIFIAYDTYLTQGGCCIGGYHNAMGSTSAPQAYAFASYVDKVGAFSQDVSALSHEIGEWADDPLVVNTSGNQTPCGVLEVGDPEETESNYGGFPYTLNGFTYNLQDLTFLPYFGAPVSTSVNDSFTFQGNPFSLTVCSNGS